MPRASNSRKYVVPPVQRAFRLLRHIAQGNEVLSPSRTAKEIEINRTTLVRLLGTLEAERMIEKRSDGGYCLGAGFWRLCKTTAVPLDVADVADSVLMDLSSRLGLSSHLAVLEDASVLYLLRRVPNLCLVSNVRLGSRIPACSVSAGRIILAHLPIDEVRQIFESSCKNPGSARPFAQFEDLVLQIQRDKKFGIAWGDTCPEPGVSSAAAPIFDHGGHIVASVNVMGPSAAFDVEPSRGQEIRSILSRAATSISEKLGYRDSYRFIEQETVAQT